MTDTALSSERPADTTRTITKKEPMTRIRRTTCEDSKDPLYRLKKAGCEVSYQENYLSASEHEAWFSTIMKNIEWKEELFKTPAGLMIPVPRKMAYLGTASYKYIGSEKPGEGWPEWFEPILNHVRKSTGVQFNYALVNYYADGSQYIGYHSDDEKTLEKNSIIASVSLGSERDFSFKRKYPKRKITEDLEPVSKFRIMPGSLLIMGKNVQKFYKHSLHKTAKKCGPRINITFRVIDNNK